MKLKKLTFGTLWVALAVTYPAMFIQTLSLLIDIGFHTGGYFERILNGFIAIAAPMLVILSIGALIDKFKLVSLGCLCSLFGFVYIYIIRPKMDFYPLLEVMLKDSSTLILMVVL